MVPSGLTDQAQGELAGGEDDAVDRRERYLPLVVLRRCEAGSLVRGLSWKQALVRGLSWTPALVRGLSWTQALVRGLSWAQTLLKGPFVDTSARKGPFVDTSARKGPFVDTSARKGPFVDTSARKGPSVDTNARKRPFPGEASHAVHFIRMSVGDKYSGSMKITTYLDHISHCKKHLGRVDSPIGYLS